MSPRVTTVEKGHAGSLLSESETMRPSFISMMRGAWRADTQVVRHQMSVKFVRGGDPRSGRGSGGVFAVEIARRLVGEQD